MLGSRLLVIGAAKRLTSGKAFGIDIWKRDDQSDNTPEAPIENAKMAGVADRVEIKPVMHGKFHLPMLPSMSSSPIGLFIIWKNSTIGALHCRRFGVS